MSATVEAELISSPMLVPRSEDLPPLTIRESAFVRHWLDPNNLRNGTDAARKAGYSGDDNTLAVIASQNLRKLHIQAHIQHALKQRHISPEEVVAELSDIALLPQNALQSAANPDSPYNANHKLKALEWCVKVHQLDKSEPEEVTINGSSLNQLSELVVTGLVEAARKRAEELANHAPQLSASTDASLT